MEKKQVAKDETVEFGYMVQQQNYQNQVREESIEEQEENNIFLQLKEAQQACNRLLTKRDDSCKEVSFNSKAEVFEPVRKFKVRKIVSPRLF